MQVRQTYTAHQKAITCLAFRDIHHLTDSQVVTEWRGLWLWILNQRHLFIQKWRTQRRLRCVSEKRRCCCSAPEPPEWSLLGFSMPRSSKQVFTAATELQLLFVKCQHWAFIAPIRTPCCCGQADPHRQWLFQQIESGCSGGAKIRVDSLHLGDIFQNQSVTFSSLKMAGAQSHPAWRDLSLPTVRACSTAAEVNFSCIFSRASDTCSSLPTDRGGEPGAGCVQGFWQDLCRPAQHWLAFH